jgi:Tol biopolymer transport system component
LLFVVSPPEIDLQKTVLYGHPQLVLKASETIHMIHTINTDGTDIKSVRAGENPRWSPCGNMIVFEHEGDIYTIEHDSSNLKKLTEGDGFNALPDFSPDGSRIVYVSNENTKETRKNVFNLWVMDVDGSNKRQITGLESWDSWPRWTERGIYFLSTRGKKGRFNTQRIWLLKM